MENDKQKDRRDLEPIIVAAVMMSLDRIAAQRGARAARPTATDLASLAEYWERTVEIVGEDLALLVAHDLPIGAFGIASIDTMSAATLAHALETLANKYVDRMVPGMQLRIITEPQDNAEIRLSCTSDHPWFALLEEIALAVLFRHLSLLLVKPPRISGVELRRPTPREASAPWHLFFGVMPRFAQPHSSLHIAGTSLSVPMRTANPEVQALVHSSTGSSTTDDVRTYMRGHLDRPWKLAEIARALGTSTRQLQRRLQAEGTALRELGVAVRVEAAERLLVKSSRSIAEISKAVGFAHAASFTRAFAAAYAETPQAYRVRRRSD